MFDKKRLFALLLAMSLAACGGGGDGTDTGNDDDDDDDDDDVVTLTGVFVDSAVAGIGYRTETQEGETNADGEFEYVDGESVTFFLGDVELPAVTAGEVVTPLDLFETDDFSDQRVINLARLLQSLDEDGDPANGITLGDAAHSAATGVTLDFDVLTETFEADADVINLVSNGGGEGTLVSADDALSHLQDLSLVGSWVLAGEEAYLAATFMADGTYLIAEGEEADDTGMPGIEYGAYEWNPLTGEIAVEVVGDTNGEWGLSHPQPDFTMLRNGDEITVTETVDGVTETATFTRVHDAENPLVGGWVLNDPSEDFLAVLVITATHYALTEIAPPNVEEPGGQTGPEFGTYTWDETSGAFAVTTEVDFNGDWGVSHETGMTVSVSGNTLILAFSDNSNEELTRVH